MTERAFPNNCPYCGDTDLWPHQSDPETPGFGEWECRSCLRAFKLSMLGQVRSPHEVLLPRSAPPNNPAGTPEGLRR